MIGDGGETRARVEYHSAEVGHVAWNSDSGKRAAPFECSIIYLCKSFGKSDRLELLTLKEETFTYSGYGFRDSESSESRFGECVFGYVLHGIRNGESGKHRDTGKCFFANGCHSLRQHGLGTPGNQFVIRCSDDGITVFTAIINAIALFHYNLCELYTPA